MSLEPAMEWEFVPSCPSCGTKPETATASPVVSANYSIGKETIPRPDHGIQACLCHHCGLHYKNVRPTRDSLEKLFERQSGNIWTEDYHYRPEIDQIQSLMGQQAFSVLDIGPSTGRLLHRLKPLASRTSGLDVVAHPGLASTLSGEFIEGYIESANLNWSGQAYDLITAFDVMEHLYDPNKAFANLNQLLKPGGYLIIETGDIDSLLPRIFGSGHWWYVNLIEHHLFWSPETLAELAGKHGFEVVDRAIKQHKGTERRTLIGRIETLLRLSWYVLNRVIGHSTARQPWYALNRDHFMLVLCKTCASP